MHEFYLRNKRTGKYYLDIARTKCHNGNNIHLWEFNGSKAQQFYWHTAPNGKTYRCHKVVIEVTVATKTISSCGNTMDDQTRSSVGTTISFIIQNAGLLLITHTEELTMGTRLYPSRSTSPDLSNEKMEHF